MVQAHPTKIALPCLASQTSPILRALRATRRVDAIGRPIFSPFLFAPDGGLSPGLGE